MQDDSPARAGRPDWNLRERRTLHRAEVLTVDASAADYEARLARLERSLMAHDFLLRALLTHLAVASPQAFGGQIGGFAKSRLYSSTGAAGELTREVTEDLTRMLEEIARSLDRR